MQKECRPETPGLQVLLPCPSSVGKNPQIHKRQVPLLSLSSSVQASYLEDPSGHITNINSTQLAAETLALPALAWRGWLQHESLTRQPAAAWCSHKSKPHVAMYALIDLLAAK